MDLINKIKFLSEEFYSEIVKIRRHLHMYPELSFAEYETSGYIKDILEKNGIPCQSGIAKTGILARMTGIKPGNKVIALRADMDALPIEEKNEKEYRSLHKGIMHACGHDAHSSSLIGTAMILEKLKKHFAGTVMLIFQPGEEKAPGGAQLMLREGIFNDIKPDLILAQHVMPSLKSGTAGFAIGASMASSDEIYITIKGRGGHAAMPHQINDTVLAASHVIIALQQIVSRQADPFTPTVLSFGKITADGAVNIIPSEVMIEGTFRTMNEEWRRTAHRKMSDMAQTIACGLGVSCEFNIVEGYPVLFNDPSITNKTRTFAISYLGENNITDLNPRMTAEDFAFYAQQIPATFYRLGVADPKKEMTSDLHTPGFDLDEEALKTGMGLMAYLAIRHLKED